MGGEGETFAVPSVAKNPQYDYDLIVIGGGSGGLAAAKEAASSDRKLRVACFDFVMPTPHNTTWGLGGTCVNVGCIPKKLFHTAGLVGRAHEDTKALGWTGFEKKHDWAHLVEEVDNYIMSLNYGYEGALRDEGVDYINALATFNGAHSVTYNTGSAKTATADKFIVAVGGRPTYPNIPGANLALSSDDIFWWKKVLMGKTLVVGASYIALECAGFLAELGHDVSIAVRSILLRGFDQQCAQQIGENMERENVRFLRPCTVASLERKGGATGPIDVVLNIDGKQVTEQFNQVLFAIGRTPLTANLGLQHPGVNLDRSGKILVDQRDTTSAPHVFAIGDASAHSDAKHGARPELTPVAIQAGQYLARRLFANSTKLMQYDMVPTVVFTPLEYGCIGMSTEDAEAAKGANNIETFLVRYGVLETAVSYREEVPIPRSQCFTHKNLYARLHALKNGQLWEDHEPEDYEAEERSRKFLKQPCLAKLVCDKTANNKVLGLHYVGPNAGEVLQGFALAVRVGCTKDDFDTLIGIHPTSAEEFTTLKTTLSSGEDFMKKGGC